MFAIKIVSDSASGVFACSELSSVLQGRFFDAVVKVYCIHTEPNYSLPWQRKRQYSSTSSGFMVKNEKGQQCLLTNAHSVEYHTQVLPYTCSHTL